AVNEMILTLFLYLKQRRALPFARKSKALLWGAELRREENTRRVRELQTVLSAIKPRSSARKRSISASFCLTRSNNADWVLIPSSIRKPAASARFRKTPAWTSASSFSCASGEIFTA